MSSLKYIVFGAILVIYLDWTRLFLDVSKVLNIVITQTQDQSIK